MKGSARRHTRPHSEEYLSAVRTSFLETSAIYLGLTRIPTVVSTDTTAPALYSWIHKRCGSTVSNHGWRE